jgi:large subunit ribosomal protein L10
LKEFRESNEKPVLKVAYIESSIFEGDNQIDVLSKLKSKEELVGEIIGLLQSPAKNVLSALQSSGGKLAGIVKTLSERPE